MAVALCLSPWPNAGTQAETTAIAYLQRVCAGLTVAGETSEQTEAARQLGSMASARVEREASSAPQAIKNAAVTRYAGYLAQADYGTIRQESIGDREVQYAVNHQRAWINCGAKSMLSPWKPLNAARVALPSEDD